MSDKSKGERKGTKQKKEKMKKLNLATYLINN